MHVLGLDLARIHAALNELPALLVVAVLFDLGGWIAKRESLKVVALWTLWAGVIGGWGAVAAGELAKRAIEHSDAIRELLRTHERVAISTMTLFTVILGWKLLRRARLGRWDELLARGLSVAGVVGVLWTQAVGSRLVFNHAAGIETKTIKAELLDRQQHEHRHDGPVPR